MWTCAHSMVVFLERYLGHLKRNGRNKAKVEGSICESHLQAESMSYCKTIVRQLGSKCEDLWIEEEHRD